MLAMRNESRLAVLGAGHVRPVIARPAIGPGAPVAVAPSGDPAELAWLGPRPSPQVIRTRHPDAIEASHTKQNSLQRANAASC